MSAFIKEITYYLPEKVLTNKDLVKDFPEWSIEKIASKVGIKERHVASADETAVDLAVKAAEKIFLEKKIEKKDIDFLLFCTQSPDYKLPTSACLIQNQLGLPKKMGALDFNLGCSGYVYGLSLAKGLIESKIAKNVLFLTAETYSKYIHPKDKGNRTIFGDAASATLISSDGNWEIGNFSLGTDGSGEDNLIVKSGGSRYPDLVNDISFDEKGNPRSSDFLFMNGAEVFNFTLSTVPDLVTEILESNCISMSDVDLFVFHQANKYMINYLRKKLKIDEPKFYYFMEQVGNTVSSSIPIALCEASKENRLKGNILLAGFGVGYSWGGCLLKEKNSYE